MKTPEEIKKALKCQSISRDFCESQISCLDCEFYVSEYMSAQISADALNYIRQLENQIGELTEKVERPEAAQSAAETFRQERDALLADLKEAAKMDCSTCKSYAPDDGRCEKADFVCLDCSLKDCPCRTCEAASNWEWRGVEIDGEAQD